MRSLEHALLNFRLFLILGRFQLIPEVWSIYCKSEKQKKRKHKNKKVKILKEFVAYALT